jgi:hypothetical protein
VEVKVNKGGAVHGPYYKKRGPRRKPRRP